MHLLFSNSKEELFIKTKLWIQDYGYENTKKVFRDIHEKVGA